MAIIKARLEGVEQALRNLDGLTRTVRNKVLRRAVNAASRLVLKAAKSLVPRGTGLLKRSLGVRVQTYRHSGVVMALVGPRTGFKRTRQGRKETAFGRKQREVGANPSKYAHLVEYGRVAARPKRARVLSDGTTVYGTVARAVAPRPFLRPAMDREKAAAEAAMSAAIAEGIQKFTKAVKLK